MTGQPNSLQILLADIQTSLDRTQPPPWAVYPQWLEQRQLLLRVKELWYLLQDRSLSPTPDPTSQTALAAISQDLTQLRSNLLSPLQQEVQALMQQRDALNAEVAELTIQVSNLQPQITPPPPEHTSLRIANEPLDLSTWQSTHDRATQLFNQLDRTIQMTFSALDQDVETYRLALTRQLEQLYDLGQRSESVIATLLQQVINETQQTTQQYLQANQPAALAASPIPAIPPAPSNLSSFPNPTPFSQPTPLPENIITTLDELLPQISHPSTAINPPTPSVDPTTNNADFTLIGLDDLFASVPPPPVPTTINTPPVPAPQFPRDSTDAPTPETYS